MDTFSRFWRQPNKAYRDFQIVYTALALNFLFPSLVYALNPVGAIRRFERIGILLGGGEYGLAAGEAGYVWRLLAAGNVLSLAFKCALLQFDLKRFYPVLVPLVFMKCLAALAFLIVFLFAYRYPAFLVVALYDGLSIFLMLYFAIRARRSLVPK